MHASMKCTSCIDGCCMKMTILLVVFSWGAYKQQVSSPTTNPLKRSCGDAFDLTAEDNGLPFKRASTSEVRLLSHFLHVGLSDLLLAHRRCLEPCGPCSGTCRPCSGTYRTSRPPWAVLPRRCTRWCRASGRRRTRRRFARILFFLASSGFSCAQKSPRPITFL